MTTSPHMPPADPTGPVTAEDLLRMAFKYQDALVSYAYGLLQDWALAQDAVQECFIVLQKKHAEFRPGGNVYTWARQIVRFEALNMRRDRARVISVLDADLCSLVDQQFEQHLETDALGALESQKSALQHCMKALEPAAVDLLLGFYRDSLSCERLAELHSKSINAVRLTLSRVRARLRQCVQRRLALAEVRP